MTRDTGDRIRLPAADEKNDIDRPSFAIPAATVLYQPQAPYLAAMFQALDQHERRLYIFVNGAIDPESVALVRGLANGKVVWSEINVGLGAALNRLVEEARSEGHTHLLLLDQDSTPTPAMPELLFRHFEKCAISGKTAAVGPLLVPPRGQSFLAIKYAWRAGESGSVHFLPTSGSLVSLAAWSHVGAFRSDYFIGGIDVEWGFRAWQMGYASTVALDVPMIHRWGTTDEEPGYFNRQIMRQSNLRLYYYVRNSMDCLKLDFIPISWKFRHTATLVAQLALLLVQRRFELSTVRTIGSSIRAGLCGELGPYD
jgi:rhamnosyltransferase